MAQDGTDFSRCVFHARGGRKLPDSRLAGRLIAAGPVHVPEWSACLVPPILQQTFSGYTSIILGSMGFSPIISMRNCSSVSMAASSLDLGHAKEPASRRLYSNRYPVPSQTRPFYAVAPLPTEKEKDIILIWIHVEFYADQLRQTLYAFAQIRVSDHDVDLAEAPVRFIQHAPPHA